MTYGMGPPTWFEVMWGYLSEAQREGVRAHSDRHRLTLPGALLDSPVLAPPALRHLVPRSSEWADLQERLRNGDDAALRRYLEQPKGLDE